MQSEQINHEVNEIKYAGFWVRSWAVSIDSLIIIFGGIILAFIAFKITESSFDIQKLGEQFSLMVMDFISQKLQNLQNMPMNSQQDMENTLLKSLRKLDAGFMHYFIPIQIIFCTLYYAIPESSRMQGSIGKYVMKIKIVNLRGERISFLRAFARNLVKILSGIIHLLVGILIYITIPFDKKKRGIHDMICKTLVVYR